MDGPSVRLWLILAAFAGLIGDGCASTTEPHPASATPVRIEPGGVTILAAPNGGLTDDDYVIDCLQRALHAARPQLILVNGHDFRDALFPWFEPDRVPADEGQFVSVLARPAVRERAHGIGVRYLVLVGSTTWAANEHGGIFCGGGYGGGGCLGLYTAEKHSSAEAKVWDLGEARAVTTLTAEASGQTVIPAFILPIPFIPATQGAVCDSTAKQLLDLLGG